MEAMVFTIMVCQLLSTGVAILSVFVAAVAMKMAGKVDKQLGKIDEGEEWKSEDEDQ